MVDVRVGQQNRLDIRVAPAHQLDHQQRFEVGVDDDRILGFVIFDQVRVGAKLPVRRRLDANRHEASRATVCTSLTPSSFSMRRESCASESISTVVETTAVLSS